MALGAPRQTATALASAIATILTLSVGEAAQTGCYAPGQQLPAQVVSRFTNDPGRLLTQFPDGGPQMISLIRDLVASDPGTLPLITELNTKANADQVQAIGTGLGQAALVCTRTAPAFAEEIQKVTIVANNKPMTQAFGAVMGDQFLGLAGPAVGGGGAGATSTIGPGGGVAAGGAPLSLTTSVANITTISSGNSGFTTNSGNSGFTTNSGFTSGSTTSGSSGGPGGGTVSTQSPRSSASAAGGSVSTGNPNGSIFGANLNSSGGQSILGNLSTPNFTANISAKINSSVSPTVPR